jgi:hypothetical protein
MLQRISSLESDSAQLDGNLDQLFLAIMGSIVFLMQVSAILHQITEYQENGEKMNYVVCIKRHQMSILIT